MALLPLILFVTTDIYEKVEIRRLKCNQNVFAVARLCKQQTFFTNTLPFFTISFHQANDVYVKIYETAQLTMFYV
jgi:hypothetical protein